MKKLLIALLFLFAFSCSKDEPNSEPSLIVKDGFSYFRFHNLTSDTLRLSVNGSSDLPLLRNRIYPNAIYLFELNTLYSDMISCFTSSGYEFTPDRYFKVIDKEITDIKIIKSYD